MKTRVKVGLALGLVLAAGLAWAKWEGRWYCGPQCLFGDQYASGETYAFIRNVVAHSVESWVDSQGNPSTVTICNGTKCATYRYVKMTGLLMYTGYYYSSWTGQETGGGGGLPGLPGDGGGLGQCTIGQEPRRACTSVGEPSGASTSGDANCQWVMVDVLQCP
jgi:hypothetical protein